MRVGSRLGAVALALACGCAPYGLHGSSRVLPASEHRVGVSIDLVQFLARGSPESRPEGALDAWLLLPTLQYARGLGRGVELELDAFPVGLRAAARAQLAGDAASRGAVSAAAGCSLVGAYVDARGGGAYRAVLLPDAALLAGARAGSAGEAYAALRYLWLRDAIAGSSFLHTPGVTLGYRYDGARAFADGEVTVLAGTRRLGDVALVPGVAVGAR